MFIKNFYCPLRQGIAIDGLPERTVEKTVGKENSATFYC